MKLKAVRASLAAVLTATLLISLFPLAYADSTAGPNQQGASQSKLRRGKTGEPVTKSADNSDTSAGPSSVAKPVPDGSKPLYLYNPVLNSPLSTENKPRKSPIHHRRRLEPGETCDVWPTGARGDSASSEPQHDPPPFDRPPLRLVAARQMILRLVAVILRRRPGAGLIRAVTGRLAATPVARHRRVSRSTSTRTSRDGVMIRGRERPRPGAGSLNRACACPAASS